MRIASQHFGNTMLATLRASNSKAADLTSKISTGQRVQRASDDPIAAARLLLIDRDTSLLQRYRNNIDTLSVRLQKNEVHLDGMLDTVMSVHDSLLSAADGSRSAADLNALAAPLRMRLDNLKQAANAKDGDGNFLSPARKRIRRRLHMTRPRLSAVATRTPAMVNCSKW
ncbi:hypothetical protein OWT26_16930 [Burkholderia sp. 1A5]